MLALQPPTVRPFCTLEVDLAPMMDLGLGRFGQRRIIPIVGGRVTGRVSGTILDLGADWQSVAHDGVAELDARYAFRTADGAVIEVVNTGYRHGPPEVMAQLASGAPTPPESYSMRSTARLESGHPDYRWLNRMVFVGTGARDASTVQIDLYSVE
ncbi:DUF3237 domain-containing protein [Cellulomonas sp. S1-8]|uniref:DUF3237 domain-containing protein n=1 Tax=Cellulomonas sp. S1-8 TaxID=2904790 RepID=UPI002243BDD3|nr:DUF3237 domain-containing protein [Cellulomonas sp. S1-8]UZN03760.1 DUF3237 domain-containing protein [Cellulomonas sp. S1-8]